MCEQINVTLFQYLNYSKKKEKTVPNKYYEELEQRGYE